MQIGLPVRLGVAAVFLGSCAAYPTGLPGPAECVVARVVDGDTFDCRDGRRVRLLGVDSPERGQGATGRLARLALLRRLPVGRPVRLESDVAATDRYGRALAYAWTGRTLVNEALVRDGWAVRYTVPPNVKYAERIGRAQNEARARGTGLWATDGFACLPRSYRRHECAGSSGRGRSLPRLPARICSRILPNTELAWPAGAQL